MSGAMESSKVIRKLHDHIDGHFDEHLERCRSFLRQKSVSDTGEGTRETASIVREFIREIGGEADLFGSEIRPVVYGKAGSGRGRTLIIYGMYDVQPAEEAKWSSPPFAAETRELPGLGPCIVARGAVNSKGALAGLFNTLRSIVEIDRLPLDLLFIIDGEEEIGSPHLEPFIQAHRDELVGIGVADFDFSENNKKQVQLYLGLKGIVYIDLVCKGGRKGGPTEPQHGSVSAWISSPVWRLTHALTSLVDEKETITIEGFYDNVADVSDKDLVLLEKLSTTIDEKAFLREMKALCFKERFHGVELLKRGLHLPIININAIHAGPKGKGTRTVLPRVATANVDIRFGPNMEPEEVLEKFKQHLARWGYDDIEIHLYDHYTWSKTDVDEPIVQKLIGAYRAHGREPEIWPMATWTAPYFVFSRLLKLPVVSGGLGHGGRPHAPDEYMTVEGLRDFEKFVATFLYNLADGDL
jgi:acetylornithine deacetylase/succinyl-diaminopimelate desuccinylase-like protein